MPLTRLSLDLRQSRKNTPRFHLFTLLFALLFSLAPTLASAKSGIPESPQEPKTYIPAKPTVEQARANILIARALQFTHYLHLKIDDKLAHKVFNDYLNDLDGQHLYFLQSDIDHFNQYLPTFATDLKTGQLDPAFDIYNTFERRIIQRIHYMLNLVNQGIDKLDFNKEQTMLLDRKDQPWATSQSQLDAVWHRRFKNAVLSMRLAGKDDKAIVKSLRQRYESQLGRAYQVHSEDAFQSYMNALCGVWDPHTMYFSPRTSENFNINMSLSLDGIGAVLQSDNEYTKVVRLIPGGPAARQGQLKPADRIIGVAEGADGEMKNVVGWRLDDVVSLIRGPSQSVVRLEVIPPGATDESHAKVIQITRSKVKLEEQAAQSHRIEFKRDGKTWHIGVIELPAFYADFQAMQRGDPNYKSTTRDVRRLIAALQKKGIDGLVLDLRNNGGGALQEANELVGLFIGDGPTVQIRNSDNTVDVLTDPDPNVVYAGPLVVLVNRLSASASEIFSGAIQDYGRGLIVGSQTFGKGTVQAVRPLNHGQLKITQSKFYRISGASTQRKGVTPDIVLPGRIDDSEIGEDTLPADLPWDQIPPVPHVHYYDFQKILPKLRKEHDARFDSNPHYQLLLKEIAFLKAQRERKTISLNYEKRKQEQTKLQNEQLALANERRKLDNKAPFKSWKAFDTWQQTQTEDPENKQRNDFVVKEGGEIIVDMLNLNSKIASINDVTPTEVAAQ
ncbi:carboxy terminal-processing peptidase [Mangrovitalea sediminis]|uniref:carboxy terminal-processing peptidase n=1 Tax=Mangrovitalea sediminis TaxID=1982043 RepID=UPI000BE609D1|nr:carboxy terminal-processing peptidase [Mangrovitalea sediminis]